MIFGALFVIVGLLISIGLHELGHFLAARRFGAKVPEFMIGFGPTLFSFQRGETHIGVKLLPLGGYVRILGMLPPAPERGPGIASTARAASARELGPDDEHRAFWRIAPHKRALVMFAGPAMNLGLALVAIVGAVSWLGTPQASNTVAFSVDCAQPRPDLSCHEDGTTSPAAAAGIGTGDVIVAVDGTQVSNWDELVEATAALTPGRAARFVVERDGDRRTVAVTPVEHPTRPGVGYVGLAPAVVLEPRPLSEAGSITLTQARQTVGAVVAFPAKVLGLTADTASGRDRVADGPVGLVGVGQISSRAATSGYPWEFRAAELLAIFAALNMSVFVFNLIPLPPLDGGQIVPALADAVRTRLARLRGLPDPHPLDTSRLLPLSYAVMLVLISMTLLVTWADLVNPL